MSLIANKELWDSLGNKCRIEMYQIGPNEFEVYTSIMGSVPQRRVGPLGQMIDFGDIWVAMRKEDGFQEQLPGYTPTPIN